MASLKTLFIWTLKGTVFVFLALIIISALIITFEIKVELSHFNTRVEMAAKKALNRDVSIRGDVILVPTLWPTLEINKVTISNPRDDKDKTNMAELGQLRLQLGLLPILSGEIHVAEVSARQVTFNFKTEKDGQSNWQFKTLYKKTDNETGQQSITSGADTTPRLQFEALDKIVFEDINIYYQDKVINKSFHFNLQQLQGSAAHRKDITFKFNGHFQDKKYSGEIIGGGINNFRYANDKWPLNIALNISGVDINLTGMLFRGGDRRLSSILTVGETDIAAILEWLEIMKGAHIGSQSLKITTELRGDSLSDLLTQSELTIELNNAWWILTDKNTAAQIPINIHRGLVSINKTSPVKIDLRGVLNKTNIKINVEGAPIIEYVKSDKQLPLNMKIKALASDLTLKTHHSKNVSVENIRFDLKLTGNKLNDLNTLFETDFPPVGPYYLQGKFAVTPGGYTIEQFRIGAKDSQLNGKLNFDTQARPPKLYLDLHSPLIQINDFDVGDWSPEKTSETEGPAEQKSVQIEKKTILSNLENY